VRIAGGEFGGRTIAAPPSGVRPTQDRVREALFSMLAPVVAGCRFLDLFAGSGSVGLEALSRGAASATFVDSNHRHLELARRNAETLLPAERRFAANFVAADAYCWIDAYSGDGFDIGFADPPYALGEEKGYAAVLAALAAHGVIAPGGVFAAEMTAAQSADAADGWELLRDRKYGKTRICIWRRNQGK